MISDLNASSVTIPPAFRMMGASPVLSPNICSTVILASMHATIASFRLGGMGKFPSRNELTYSRLAPRTSSMTLMCSPSSAQYCADWLAAKPSPALVSGCFSRKDVEHRAEMHALGRDLELAEGFEPPTFRCRSNPVRPAAGTMRRRD